MATPISTARLIEGESSARHSDFSLFEIAEAVVS